MKKTLGLCLLLASLALAQFSPGDAALSLAHKVNQAIVDLGSARIAVEPSPSFLVDPPVDTLRTAYPFPAVPPIPAAGGYVTDPVFGTKILRLSTDADGLGGNGCGVGYSYWASMNKDSTRVQIGCNSAAKGNYGTVFDFDPVAFTASNERGLFSACGVGAGIRQEDALWSGSESHTIFAQQWSKLYKCDVDSGPGVLLHDFASDLPVGGYIWQISKSQNDNVFAGNMRDGNYTDIGYIVWRKSDNKILLKVSNTNTNEVQLDKSGRYLLVKPNGVPPVGQPLSYVVDLATGVSTGMAYNDVEGPPGHSDNGSSSIIGYDNWNNCWDARSMATPHVKVFALCKGKSGKPGDWATPGFDGMHLSALADDENWVVVSDEMPVTAPVPFFLVGEIYQLSTDGSQKVRHIAHTWSISDHNAYGDYPKANVSRDGKFITYTSNWGRGVGGHTDVFIVAVKPAH